ncbi:MAG: FG-GAP-like repeat-containing protein [Bacillota bacterium]
MPELKDYTLSMSGYGLGGAAQAAAGDTDGSGSIQAVVGTETGEMYVLGYKKRNFSLRRYSRIGLPIHSLGVVEPKDSEPNGIITGIENYALLYEWEGDKYHQKARTHYLGGRVLDIASSDLNKDGKQEVVITAEGAGVQVYTKSLSSLTRIWNREPHSITRAAIGDVNGDGRKEMVLIDITDRLPFRVSVLRVSGRSFKTDIEENISQRISGPIFAADIDNDGRAEIVFSGPRQRRFLVFKIENRRLVRQFVSDIMPGTIVDFGAGDVNGDRRTELVVATTDEVFVFRWNGRTFVLVDRIDIVKKIVRMIVKDVNHDGIDEIIIGTADGRFFILRPRPTSCTQFMVSEDVKIPGRLPDIRRVIRAEVDDIIITGIDRLSSGVLVRGSFEVGILYSSRPDGRVVAFTTRIPFSAIIRTPVVFGKILDRNIDIKVEYTNINFDPDNPREVRVIIIAQVCIFNFIVPKRITLPELSREVSIPKEILAEINELNLNSILNEGDRILVPENYS